MKTLCLALAAPLFLTSTATAGDVIAELIPADAKWVAHVDVEGFLGTSLWTSIREVPEIAEGLAEGMAEAEQELGVNPLTVVKSVTAYGSSEEPDEGVAILVVSQEADELIDRLREEDEHEKAVIDGYAVDVWSEDDESVFAHVRRFDGVSNRLVFISDSAERLMNGIAVLEGRVPDVTQDRGASLRVNPKPGTFLYVETGEDIPGIEEVEQMSAIAALAKGARFEVGEAAGQMFADLEVTTNNAKDAGNIYSVLQGAAALLNLVMDGEVPQEVRQLVNSLDFGTNGNVVGVAFRYDSRELVNLLKKLEEMD